jgi:hypothetical protein
MSVSRGRNRGGRFSPGHPASSVYLSWPVAPFPFFMIACAPHDFAARELPALAFCWSCNLKRPVVEFNPRTQCGLCGGCKAMIFRAGPMRGLTDEERKAKREIIQAPCRRGR